MRCSRWPTPPRQLDGSEPLSEQFRLSVRAREHDGVEHLLAMAADGVIVGYAQSRSGDGSQTGEGSPSGELVVAPGARRAGVGTALLDALPDGIRAVEPCGRRRGGRRDGLRAGTRPRARARPPCHGALPHERGPRGPRRRSTRGMPSARSSPAVTRTPGWPSTPPRSRTTRSRGRCGVPTSTSGWRSRGGTPPGSSSSSRPTTPTPWRPRTGRRSTHPPVTSARSTSWPSRRTGRGRGSDAPSRSSASTTCGRSGSTASCSTSTRRTSAAVRTYRALGFEDLEVHRQFARTGRPPAAPAHG